MVSYPAAQQLFPEEYIWNLILSHLGFKLNDWDLPVLHGFFEIKSLKDILHYKNIYRGLSRGII